MYFTYVLRSRKDKMFYSEFIEDLEQRLDKHSKGAVQSTKNRRPLYLIYYEACIKKDDAIRREKYFKTHYRKMFLHKRLNSYLAG